VSFVDGDVGTKVKESVVWERKRCKLETAL